MKLLAWLSWPCLFGLDNALRAAAPSRLDVENRGLLILGTLITGTFVLGTFFVSTENQI